MAKLVITGHVKRRWVTTGKISCSSAVTPLYDTISMRDNWKIKILAIPRSIFSSDCMFMPTDKSAFVHVVKEYKVEPSSESGEDLMTPDASKTLEGQYNVCITNAMAVVQSYQEGSIDGKLL